LVVIVLLLVAGEVVVRRQLVRGEVQIADAVVVWDHHLEGRQRPASTGTLVEDVSHRGGRQRLPLQGDPSAKP